VRGGATTRERFVRYACISFSTAAAVRFAERCFSNSCQSRLYAAALVRAGTLETTSRAISSLFMSRRIVVNENAFGFQIWELFVPRVAVVQGRALTRIKEAGLD
jgi:hypothetical protein